MITANRSIKLFLDFDGTFTLNDVGEGIFTYFAGQEVVEQIIEDIKNLKLRGIEGWNRLFEKLPTIDISELNSFIDKVEIDPYAKELIAFCVKHKIELYILSDGFDYYIKRILSNNGINNIPFFANRLVINNNNSWHLEFPYRDEECNLCGNCKRNHILLLTCDDEITIYVGDGSSDVCPIQHCDYIFAKKTLLRFCESERISFTPFNNLNDVIDGINKLITKKRIKKSRQAELKRKAVYMQG